MGIFYEPDELNIVALEDTLKAVELLLPTYDLDGKSNAFFDGQSRLGFPAAILLFCFIESVGHLTQKRKNSTASFNVLREDWFENLKLTVEQCEELYGVYRSKLCHNMMLPAGFVIDCLPEDTNPFGLSADSKNVALVNLYALLQISKRTLAKIKDKGHKNIFNNSKALMDVLKNSIKFDDNIFTVTPSGITALKG